MDGVRMVDVEGRVCGGGGLCRLRDEFVGDGGGEL